MTECPRCSRPVGGSRATCIYCGARAVAVEPAAVAELVPPRARGGKGATAALLPGPAAYESILELAALLDVGEFQAQQLARRPVPVVFARDTAEAAAALCRNLRRAGLRAVWFEDSELDEVPAARTVVSLTVGSDATRIEASPYRDPAITDRMYAVDATGHEQWLRLRDLQFAAIGEIACGELVVDLYGALPAPLRLLARASAIRGLGVRVTERAAALARFAAWLGQLEPALPIDRGYKIGVERTADGWDSWSTRAWVIWKQSRRRGLRRFNRRPMPAPTRASVD